VAERSEFFNDWIKPQRIGEAALFATVLQERATIGVLCMAHDEQGHYEETDRQFLSVLMPHFQQALRLQQRMTSLESQKEAAERALDSWSVGIVILDPSGSVVLANRSARAMFDRKLGISLDGRELRASTVRETRLLRDLVGSAVGTTMCCSASKRSDPSPERLKPGGVMVLPRLSDGPPLQLLVSPIGPNASLGPARGAGAVVFISDPAATPPERHELLRRLYGFTRGESRVVVLLLEGKSLPAIANELGISLNTVKTHATRIYAKTRTRGHADLVRSVAQASSIATAPGVRAASPVESVRHPIG
jgi:DNA-binding CsgD family transcriptional regulator